MSLSIVGVHLDLKYLMPDKAFLNRWVAELPELGINTLLLEYEDKFPFARHPFLRAKNAFTPRELRVFLSAARGAGVRVIPLVQTLSHLEFALSHEELAGLREAPHIHTQIDTSNPQAIEFVHGLVDEVMAYHTEDEFFHLGGDEAWHLGHNERTKAQVEQIGEVGVWAKHMLPLTQKIVAAGKRPVLWEDVVDANPSILSEAGVPRETVFIPWHYGLVNADKANRRLAGTKVIRQAGYDLIAAPCLNWGVMTPRHLHCLRNTAELTRYALGNNYLGVINTAWACFHVLPHAQALYIAATGAAAKAPDAVLEPAWRGRWLAEYFGTAVAGLDEALEAYGQLTEYEIEGLARPVTLVVYGYMDYLMALASIDQRKALGGYPSDVSRVDQRSLFVKKLSRVREPAARAGAQAMLDKLIAQYTEHAPAMERIAKDATRRQKEAEFLAVSARLKLVHAKIMSGLVSGDTIGAELVTEWEGLGPRLAAAIAPFVEADDVGAAVEMWWGATRSYLESIKGKHGTPAKPAPVCP